MIDLDMTLRDYSLLESKDEIDFAIKYSKKYNAPVDVFKVGDLTGKSFGLIKDLQFDIPEMKWDNLLTYIFKLTGKNEKELGGVKLITICQFFSFIKKEIERINNLESELLSYTPASDEKKAGIDNYNQFGAYGQLRALAGGDVSKIKEVEKVKYSIAIMELYYRKVDNDYQKRLFDIRHKK